MEENQNPIAQNPEPQFNPPPMQTAPKVSKGHKKFITLIILVITSSIFGLFYFFQINKKSNEVLPKSSVVINDTSPDKYTNNAFHYSFVIPEGWRVFENLSRWQNTNDFGFKVEDLKEAVIISLTNISKETEALVSSYLLNDSIERTPEIDASSKSVIQIYVWHRDTPYDFSKWGETGLPATTYEVLETEDGSQIGYRYATNTPAKNGALFNLKTGGILPDRREANVMMIIFPLVPQQNLTQENITVFLKSFRVN